MIAISAQAMLARRRVVLYIITHGQCHIPVELVTALKGLAYLYGIIILPSSEVSLDYLPLFDRYQIVTEEALASREGRKDRALDILEQAQNGGGGGGGGKPGASTSPADRTRREAVRG